MPIDFSAFEKKRGAGPIKDTREVPEVKTDQGVVDFRQFEKSKSVDFRQFEKSTPVPAENIGVFDTLSKRPQPVSSPIEPPAMAPADVGKIESYEDGIASRSAYAVKHGIKSGGEYSYKLVANAFGTLRHNLGKNAPPGTEWLEKQFNALADYSAPKKDAKGLGPKVISGALQAPVHIFLMYIAGGGNPILGAAITGALSGDPEKPLEQATGAAKGALTVGALKGLEPLSRAARVSTGAGLFGGLTAAEGGTAEDITTQAIIGGGLMLQGGKKKLTDYNKEIVLELSATNKAANIAKVEKHTKFVTEHFTDPQTLPLVINMALGKAPPPKGFDANYVLEAAKAYSVKIGDAETFHRLVTESTLPGWQERVAKAPPYKLAYPSKVIHEINLARLNELRARKGDKSPSEADVVQARNDLDVSRAGYSHTLRAQSRYLRDPKYGEKNHITTEVYNRAIDHLRSLTNQVNALPDASQLKELAVIAAYHMEASGWKFKQYATHVVEDVGIWVKPYLVDMWMGVDKIRDGASKSDYFYNPIKKARPKPYSMQDYYRDVTDLNGKLDKIDFDNLFKQKTIFDGAVVEAGRTNLKAIDNLRAMDKNLDRVTVGETKKLLDLYNATSNAQKVLDTQLKSVDMTPVRTLQSKGELLKIGGGEPISMKRTKEISKKHRQDAKVTEARKAYGASRAAYEGLIDNLSGTDRAVKTMLKNRWERFVTEVKADPTKATGKLALDAVKEVRDNSIAVVASFDNSFIGRQGIQVLMTHPTAWGPAAWKSGAIIYKTLRHKGSIRGEKDMFRAVMADVYGRENYLNGFYEKAKIFTKSEEQYPTSLPGKLPWYAGAAFTASEYAFTGSAVMMRTKLMDIFIETAQKNGVKINDKWLEDFGKMTNSLTGRGKIGKGADEVLRTWMWAPKLLKGNWDVLTAHTGGYGLTKGTGARREAFKNIAKIGAEMFLIQTISNALVPGSAEQNPASTDFGRLKYGKTRFDYTGGMGPIVVLGWRLGSVAADLARGKEVRGWSKSTSTGQTKQYGGAYGRRTMWDVATDFISNKSHPLAKVVVDALKGQHFDRSPFSKTKAAYHLAVPISIQQTYEAYDNRDWDKLDVILGVIADYGGISSNTYRSWGKKRSGDPTKPPKLPSFPGIAKPPKPPGGK